jgi:hypothetical protein
VAWVLLCHDEHYFVVVSTGIIFGLSTTGPSVSPKGRMVGVTLQVRGSCPCAGGRLFDGVVYVV